MTLVWCSGILLGGTLSASGESAEILAPAHESPLMEWNLQLRAEVESFHNQYWVPGFDETYYLQRAILETRWKPAPGLEVIATPFHAWVWGKEFVTPIDMDRLSFLELGIDLRMAEHHRLHIGRQILNFGSGRLVSSRMGPNVPRSFDAIRYEYATDTFNAQFFYAREVRSEPGAFDDPVFHDDFTLWGVYSTWKPVENQGLDLYFLGTEMRDDRLSLGMRYFGKTEDFDWNLEAIGQTGDDILAGSIASTIAWTFQNPVFHPRLGLKTSISSGDDSGTSRNETFSPLYPRGDYFSETATVGPLNHIELHWFLDLALGDRTKLLVESASLWKTRRDDAIYSVPGIPIRPANSNGGRFIGQETSISLTHQLTDSFSTELSGSWFHPGSAVTDTGPADDMLYWKVSAALRF